MKKELREEVLVKAAAVLELESGTYEINEKMEYEFAPEDPDWYACDKFMQKLAELVEMAIDLKG